MVMRRKFSWKFKLKAVKLVTQREVSMPQAAKFDNPRYLKASPPKAL